MCVETGLESFHEEDDTGGVRLVALHQSLCLCVAVVHPAPKL